MGSAGRLRRNGGQTRMYTDIGLLTADPQICQEVHDIFLLLTSVSQAPTLEKLLCPPFSLYEGLLEKIETEAANARAGRSGRIIAKMNSLVDPGIIEAQYRASCAGVHLASTIRYASLSIQKREARRSGVWRLGA
ncbi:MAG: hypothetical protein GY811_30525 [Myxococcales bacterium]|nr:hypothetical protein [Myxococcales bacterium]